MCWQWLARRAADDDADGRADVVGDVELLDEPTEDVELVDERAVALFALAEVAARAIPAPAASPATATTAPIASRPSAPANPPRDINALLLVGLRHAASRPPAPPVSRGNLAEACCAALRLVSTRARTQGMLSW